jgi:hypothetical protein
LWLHQSKQPESGDTLLSWLTKTRLCEGLQVLEVQSEEMGLCQRRMPVVLDQHAKGIISSEMDRINHNRKQLPPVNQEIILCDPTHLLTAAMHQVLPISICQVHREPCEKQSVDRL